MKTLLTFVFALTFSQVYAQASMSGSSSSGAIMNSHPNATRPAFNPEVPYKGAPSGDVMRRNSDTTSDTIGTTQSSTTTTTTKTKRRVIPITPANTNPSGVNCVDRSGRSFGAGDSGYTACVNSMRTR